MREKVARSGGRPILERTGFASPVAESTWQSRPPPQPRARAKSNTKGRLRFPSVLIGRSPIRIHCLVALLLNQSLSLAAYTGRGGGNFRGIGLVPPSLNASRHHELVGAEHRPFDTRPAEIPTDCIVSADTDHATETRTKPAGHRRFQR